MNLSLDDHPLLIWRISEKKKVSQQADEKAYRKRMDVKNKLQGRRQNGW